MNTFRTTFERMLKRPFTFRQSLSYKSLRRDLKVYDELKKNTVRKILTQNGRQRNAYNTYNTRFVRVKKIVVLVQINVTLNFILGLDRLLNVTI